MMDPDKTAKIKTITRCLPRDRWNETQQALVTAHMYAPAPSIREAIEQLLQQLQGDQHEAPENNDRRSVFDSGESGNIRRAVGG